MELKPEYNNLYCIVGKSKNTTLPHVISCTIGLDNVDQAQIYTKQMERMRDPYDARRKLYQWAKPMLLADVMKDNNVLIHHNDLKNIETYFCN
jgi:hypothetical protein